jgi:uncharacterized protein (DUF4415 family)
MVLQLPFFKTKDDIITWYKSNEKSHQIEINSLLREYIKNH